MTQFETSTVCIHLITEGPTDRKLLSALIPEMLEDRLLQFVEISSTQRVRTGKQAILNNHSIFSKFLHHGCSADADIIVVCVDNDRRPVKEGVGEDIITQISVFYEKFLEKNTFYQNPPCLVCAVPVSTIDYWMKAISERKSDCNEILPAMNIPRERIKEETYGKKCVFRGTFIDEGAIERKVKEIRKDGSLEKLRCLPSFQDFERYLKACFEERLSPGLC
ncbi:hypothetical protein L21_0004 [Methanoculleus chikugoensis]|uniref:DUF4276 domain-containing protein n=2 Tax=Methanoculleus chikugoensis TaxID=118126 RepID=A0A1M4MH30_9EURY|nr:hypothetical protein L21_0004 [Methanoculleus chikugoensis]